MLASDLLKIAMARSALDSGPLESKYALRGDLLHVRRYFDFNLPWQRNRGHWRRDLENAVHELGVDFFRVHAFGQLQHPLELAVGEFLMERFMLFGFARILPL